MPTKMTGRGLTSSERGIAMSDDATLSKDAADEIISTGVDGLDHILGGGLPGSRLYLVQGTPGTGKTTLALQFLLAGARRGEKCAFVSLSQSKSELIQIAASHGWSLDGIHVEEFATFDTMTELTDQTIFHSAEIRLDRTLRAVEERIERDPPRRIVYDSLLEIRQLSGDLVRFRREILGFKAFLARLGIAALLVDTAAEHGGDRELEAVAHGIIHLDKTLPEYGVARRRVEVKKMRGVGFSDG